MEAQAQLLARLLQHEGLVAGQLQVGVEAAQGPADPRLEFVGEVPA